MGKGQRRYSPQEINRVHDLYLTGNSPTRIAEATKIPWRTIYDWILKGGWQEERDEIARKAAEKRKEQVVMDRVKVDRIYFGIWNSFLRDLKTYVLDQIKDIPNLKDRTAAFCTAGYALLRAETGHNLSMGIPKGQENINLDDEITTLTDQELQDQVDALTNQLAEAESVINTLWNGLPGGVISYSEAIDLLNWVKLVLWQYLY